MQDALLATKFYIPAARSGLVARPDLIEHLTEGLTRKLTLVSAPAGFGKTTLVRDWVLGADKPVAWLSLDVGDNDLTRFFSYLIAALQRIEPSVGQTILNTLNSPELPPIHALVTVLINDITSTPFPFVLVLDDYHTIQEMCIHEALRVLLDRQPDQMHLVVTTREDPPLPLARLRARGQMTEIRASHLRFKKEETDTFLNQLMGLSLTEDEVTTLAGRTEGWIAGLQLAALSLRDQVDRPAFVRAFSGTDRYIMDYLVDEVLSQQSPEIQDFLLRTSFLERLSGPLCDAVVEGKGDSQSILEYLEQTNLFLVPLDNQRVWYRYHHLFAELLRIRLRQVLPDLMPTLYSNAANWCQGQGLIHGAMNYALAGADWELAADWLEQNAVAFLSSGEMASLVKWIKALPKEVVRRRPKLSVELAWMLTFANRLKEVEPLLNDAESALDGSPDSEPSPSLSLTEVDKRVIRARVNLLRSYMALVLGNPSRAIELAKTVRQLLLDDNPESAGCARELMYTYWVAGYAYRILGDLPNALDSFSEAVQFSRQTDELWQTMVAMTDLAIVYRHRGQLNKAADLFQEILQLADNNGIRSHGYLGRVESNLSLVLLEQNQLDEALRYANRGVESTQYWQSALHLAGTFAFYALVQMAHNDLNGAGLSLQKADTSRREFKVLPIVDSVVEATQVRFWLRQGNLTAAERWADELQIAIGGDLNGKWAPDESLEVKLIALARVLLAKIRERSDDALFKECQLLLNCLSETSRKAGRINALIEIGVLQSVLQYSLEPTKKSMTPQFSKDSPALTALAATLELAEPEGYVRIFVDEGQLMSELLYQAASQGIFPEYCGRLLAAFPEAEAVTNNAQATAGELIEPLSEREVEVLQLISEGLSNSETAQRLYLSLNTVKGHTRNIYAKLNVNSRTQAVAKARALGISPPE